MPSTKDYCYHETTKKDKEKSTDDLDAFIVKITCKRRKPQPARSEAAIYRDPHDKKYIQLSFACNDGSFNGADPFLILQTLGNADTKAVIPAAFTKCPKIVYSDDDENYTLQFYHLDTDDPAEYILKYMCKSPIPILGQEEIVEKVLQRMVYQPQNTNSDSQNQNRETLKPKHVYAMYNQSAVQHTVCHFMAVHVLLGLPIVLKNYSVKTYNCVGRKTVTKKSTKAPSNTTGEFGQIFNPTIIEHFDNRVSDLDLDDDRKRALATRRLGQQNLALIGSTTSLRTIFDKFHWTRKRKDNDSGKQEYQISTRNRFPSGKIVYNALRFVPHIQMSHANPNSKYFPQFCKVMVLCFAEYDQIALKVLSDLEAYKNSHPNITDPKIIQEQYWIETFYATFPRPNFIGLPPSYRGYHNKLDNLNIFSHSED